MRLGVVDLSELVAGLWRRRDSDRGRPRARDVLLAEYRALVGLGPKFKRQRRALRRELCRPA